MFRVIIIFLLQYYCTSFIWPQQTKYDFIVGISASGEPLCPGVIVTKKTIITSANPLEKYLGSNAVDVQTVFKRYNESLVRAVAVLHGDQSLRSSYWVQMGFDKTHTSIHDLVLIELAEDIVPSSDRGPTFAVLPWVNSIFRQTLPDSGWSVAGFGYTDKEHVENNTFLIVTKLEGSLVDCDEWIPREWGLFICISDEQMLRNVPSGGPLFMERKGRPMVYGIGSFSLRKGNESILVFTNLKKYRFGLKGYVADVLEDKLEKRT